MKDKTYSLLIYLLLTLLILCLVSLAIIVYIDSQEQFNKNKLVKTPCRTVTVYDYNGQEIESWSGKFDVYLKKPTNSVYFDTEEGKRVFINGGIIICEDN